MPPLVFALLASFFWGMTPIFEKLALVHASPLVALTLRSLIATACLAVLTLLSGGFRELGDLPMRTFVWITVASLTVTTGVLLYFYALKADLASRVVPISGSYLLFTSLIALLVLHEQITAARLLGTVLIVFGVLLVR
ncbi:MAG: EamA family transporter [Deltaproteobacteria bacterium]|nr:EamA family transporter [Deltaproteobacteria bacterium]MBI3079608.1 EamA family transporter [Deltaproteobacteria bacterium]